MHYDSNDAPRFVGSAWLHKSYPFGHGAVRLDPTDVFHIGQDPGFFGQAREGKVLGAITPEDRGETDWTIMAIDISNPNCPYVDNYDDVEKFCPGVVEAYYERSQYYKVAR